MDKCVVMIDNSNVYIEGRKCSARSQGMVKQPGDEREPSDPLWRIDFGGFLTFLADGRTIQEAILVGSRPPQNDSVWHAAEAQGFSVTVHDRGFDGKEKAVDTELAVQATIAITSAIEPMALVIASGDRDFIPLVTLAHSRGWDVEMAAFASAYPQDGAMATSVDRIRVLDDAVYNIGVRQTA
jgi:hypothetical protein